MAGSTLNVSASLQCPHGGQVRVSPVQRVAKAGGSLMATSGEVFTIAGCPFQLPGPTPSPCVRIRWLISDSRVKVAGQRTLSQGSTGLCLSAAGVPQGPVVIAQTQKQVSTQ